MEISAIEINTLCNKISETIPDYFLSGIYSMEQGILLRINHASKPEKLIAVSSFAAWLTTKNLSVPMATKFVGRLRLLERFALLSAGQVGNERITKFTFRSRKDESRDLYAELFAHGNFILADSQQDDLILDVEKPQSFRHRILEVGEKYQLPPSRGIALQEVKSENLVPLFSSSIQKDEDLSAIRWFGRSVGTSRKFVEEIFHRTKIDPTFPLKSLSRDDIERLSSTCSNLVEDLRNSDVGYILMPLEGVEDVEIDVCPIIPHSWKILVEASQARIDRFPSLSDALDEVLGQSIILERRRSVSQKTRARAAELASAIQKQAAQIELNKIRRAELRSMAGNLMTSQLSSIEPGTDVVNKLLSFEILEPTVGSGNRLRFVTEPRSFLNSYNGTALGSRLFDEAKRLDAESNKIEEVMRDLEEQRANLDETTKSQEEKAERKLITDRRERQWFERYRWFVTSDGRLALGGRDSTSNSIVVNKYTQSDDTVFHADLHGSPFFILKSDGDSQRDQPSDEISLEMAQATVSFSRAWKDELGSADAFWVLPGQVKKSAPSGEYLARGSFFIEGRKNFVRHVRVGLSVGITSTGSLPILRTQEKSEEDIGELLVVCGPEKSIGSYCHSHVRIAPGKEKGTIFARRLKQQLVNKLKDGKVKESGKKVLLDDILRVLPAGAYKIVSEKQKN
jgi:predicted ribosome quality control (RQC) complex YloA/Tae2 family protein